MDQVQDNDLWATKNSPRVKLIFDREFGEPLSAFLHLTGMPIRGERHFIVFAGDMTLEKYTGWYEVIESHACALSRDGYSGTVRFGFLPNAKLEVDEERERICFVDRC